MGRFRTSLKPIKIHINIMKEKIKAWFLKNWFITSNYVVLLLTYAIIYGKEGTGWAQAILTLWMIASAGYGGYKLFSKKTPTTV